MASTSRAARRRVATKKNECFGLGVGSSATAWDSGDDRMSICFVASYTDYMLQIVLGRREWAWRVQVGRALDGLVTCRDAPRSMARPRLVLFRPPLPHSTHCLSHACTPTAVIPTRTKRRIRAFGKVTRASRFTERRLCGRFRLGERTCTASPTRPHTQPNYFLRRIHETPNHCLSSLISTSPAHTMLQPPNAALYVFPRTVQ